MPVFDGTIDDINEAAIELSSVRYRRQGDERIVVGYAGARGVGEQGSVPMKEGTAVLRERRTYIESTGLGTRRAEL